MIKYSGWHRYQIENIKLMDKNYMNLLLGCDEKIKVEKAEKEIEIFFHINIERLFHLFQI